eukprot:3257413-Pleurochrysis_carterae.AAC.1
MAKLHRAFDHSRQKANFLQRAIGESYITSFLIFSALLREVSTTSACDRLRGNYDDGGDVAPSQ